MKFTDLPSNQQALLQNSDLAVRRAIMAGREAIALMDLASLDYSSLTSSIYSSLDVDEKVPTICNYAGIVDVQPAAIAAMITAFDTLVTAWNTPEVRALHAAFIGAVNIDGRS